jgi:hypothetical protein
MRITSSGVGIGTSIPTATLDVLGSVQATSIIAGDITSDFGIATNNIESWGLITAENGIDVTNGNVTVENGDLTVSGSIHSTNAIYADHLEVSNGGITTMGAISTYMGLTSWGEVNATGAISTESSIDAGGSITAGNGLNVNLGNVTVSSGDLVVTRGKVQVKNWTIEPADYVFEKDYKLPPLNEVEKYVKENKHLSEVPSAKEMKANGMDLTEMNMRLLKKVEELTLYTIKLNKEVEELKGKVK